MARSTRRYTTALVLAAMVVATIVVTWLVYRPGFPGEFYFDDRQNIVEASPLHWESFSWSEVRRTWFESHLPTRFLPNVSFALNHLLGGLNPAGYHRVNWVLHIAVGAALAWVCLGYLRTERRGNPAGSLGPGIIALSALFLLHPLCTQSVTYIVQRMNVMATLFALLSFGCYLAARKGRSGAPRSLLWGASLAFWLMAVLSKENALMLPFVVVVHEACFYPDSWKRAVRRLVTTFRGRIASMMMFSAAVLAMFVVWDYFQLSDTLRVTETWPNRDYNGLERVLTQSRVQLFYLSLLLWPTPARLSLEHGFTVSRSLVEPWTTLPAILFWVALASAAVFFARKYPRFSFPVLAYLLLHAIESGPINLELVFEHRMYLPLAFLMLLPIAGVAALPGARRWSIVVLVLVLCIPAAAVTWKRNMTWGDPVAFHQDVAAKAPGLYRPQYNLGTLMGRMGRLGEARAALERALKLNPDSSEAHNQLGNISHLEGDLLAAVEHYNEAVRLGPGNVEAVYNLAMTLDRAGRPAEAVAWYRRFLEIVPPYLQWKIPEVRQRVHAIGQGAAASR